MLAQGADPTKALGGALLLELAVTHGRNAVAEFLRERGIDQSCPPQPTGGRDGLDSFAR